MIRVNFRVTGMYLGSNSLDEKKGAIIVEVKENPTVFDVMKAVSDKVKTGYYPNIKSFSFTPQLPQNRETINAIFVEYVNGPREYLDGGTYMLQDEMTSNRIITFQYYIFDQEFRQLNNNNFSVSFGNQLEEFAIIKDGYSVVVRQVCIVNKPIKSKFIQSKVDGLSS